MESPPPASGPPPGSFRPHVRTLAESARIAPLSLSCFPKSLLLPGSKTRNNIHDSCFTGGAKSEHRKGPIQSIEIIYPAQCATSHAQGATLSIFFRRVRRTHQNASCESERGP